MAWAEPMRIMKATFVVLCVCAAFAWAQGDSAQPVGGASGLSEGQHFEVRFTSHMDPIAINTMHAWTLHIRGRSDKPVTDATVEVEGGMPDHDHGLPTQPRVTQNLGGGDYLLEGMKFHMGGWWQVTLLIRQGETSDRVTFDLNL